MDEVSEVLQASEKGIKAELLLKSLSAFDVRSNKPLDLPETVDSKWAVMNNMLLRGTPTLAPIMMQDLFSVTFDSSIKPDDKDAPSLKYKDKGNIDQYGL